MNANFKSWSLDINATSEEKIEYAQMMDDLFSYGGCSPTNYFLDLNKKKYGFIEKFIYDIAIHHFDRLGIKEINDNHVSFWFRFLDNGKNDMNIHIDHDYYEHSKKGTELLRPMCSTLTYLNESSNPSLITEVTLEMSKSKVFHKLNKSMCFSFPKIMKHVCFNSGKYFHGETSLIECKKRSKRQVLVIAIWDKNNKPLHVPFFNNDMFEYWRFSTLGREIKPFTVCNESHLVNFMSIDSQIQIIPITDNRIINNDFFDSLISNVNVQVVQKLSGLINKFRSKSSTFVLDFSSIMLERPSSLHPYLENGLRSWKIVFHDEHLFQNKCVEALRTIKSVPVLLDMEKTDYNIVEKFVRDIAESHFANYISKGHSEKDFFDSFFVPSGSRQRKFNIDNNEVDLSPGFVHNCRSKGVDDRCACTFLMKPIISSMTYFDEMLGGPTYMNAVEDQETIYA